MSISGVEYVWIWRFTKTPFKATYGRLAGTTYSKDFLQASGQCGETLAEAFGWTVASDVNLVFQWANGTRNGKLKDAADWSTSRRMILRWETNHAPDPWRLAPDNAVVSLRAIPGNPDHGTEDAADREWATLEGRQLDPFLMAVKFYDDRSSLFVMSALGNSPSGMGSRGLNQLPQPLQKTAHNIPEAGGCSVTAFERGSLSFDTATSVFTNSNTAAPGPITYDPNQPGGTFTTPYTPVGDIPPQTPKAPSVPDPDLIDRGTQAHMTLQDELAKFVHSHLGAEPLKPGPGDPPFDLAWRVGGRLYVVEVKSITDSNEVSQLRLGLGQILDYVNSASGQQLDVQGVLAVEREPSAVRWVDVCLENGIVLVWPDVFESLTAIG